MVHLKISDATFVRSLSQVTTSYRRLANFSMPSHMVPDDVNARVMVYRLDPKTYEMIPNSRISFMISSSTANHVHALAKSYFRASSENDQLLLKTILSDPSVDSIQWTSEDNIVYGMHFEGDHYFEKSRLDLKETHLIRQRFTDSEEDLTLQVSNRVFNEIVHEESYDKEDLGKDDKVLPMAFLNADHCAQVAIGKNLISHVKVLSKDQALKVSHVLSNQLS